MSELSYEQQRALDEEGYLLIPELLSRQALERARAAFEKAMAKEEKPASTRRETGTRHAEDLLDQEPWFHELAQHPKVLACSQHVLQRPFRLLFFTGRDPLPGFGQQGLHTDWQPRHPKEAFQVVTALWILDDFTEQNGATRLIPKSHRWPRLLPKTQQRPNARHPDQRLVCTPAASVLIFNGHLWHSGTCNRSTGPRRVLQQQFVATA